MSRSVGRWCWGTWAACCVAAAVVGGCTENHGDTVSSTASSGGRLGASASPAKCSDRFRLVKPTAGMSWRLAGDIPVTAPVLAGSSVVFGSNGPTVADGGCVGAIDSETGRLQWIVDDPIDPRTLPVPVNDLVVASVSNGQFTGFETANGDVRWHTASTGTPGATPAVDDGLVFTGAGSTVRAVGAADGADQWSFSVDGQLTNGVMDDDLVVVSAFSDGALATYALDRATGALRWRTHDPESVAAVWAITPSTVIEKNSPSVMAGLDREGHQLWTLDVPGSNTSEPVVDGNEIYFTADDYGLYAVDAPTGRVGWVRKLDSFTGGRPLLNDGVLITFAGFFDPQPAVVAIDARTGEQRWRTRFADSAVQPAGTEPFVLDGTIYVGYGLTSDTGGVVAIDPNSGALLGQLSLPFVVQRTLAGQPGRVFIRAGDKSIAAIPLPLPLSP